jgi:hypothetical protein
MPSINQDCELNRARSSDFTQCIEGRSNCATREENVINEDYISTFNSQGRDYGRHERFGSTKTKIISMQGDVESSNLNIRAFNRADTFGDSKCEMSTSCWNP